MKFKLMAIVLALVGAITLAACGSDESGQPTTTAAATSTAAPNGVDRAFAREMIPHHRSAIEMAQIGRERGQSAFVRGLSADIIRTQTSEIALLTARDDALARRGVAVGSLGVPDDQMGMDHDASTLRSADDFDRAFIEMMISHHEGAIVMARAEIARGGDAGLRRLAEQIITAQQGEINAMQAQLGEAAPDTSTQESEGSMSESTPEDHSGH